jgi:gluconate:H+ symporter, GntP family
VTDRQPAVRTAAALLALSTKGSLKILTMATSLGAVVSLPLVLAASLVAAAV